MLVNKYYSEVENMNVLLSDIYSNLLRTAAESDKLKIQNQNLKVENDSMTSVKEFFEDKIKEDSKIIKSLKNNVELLDNKWLIEKRKTDELEKKLCENIAEFEIIKDIEFQENRRLAFSLKEETKKSDRISKMLREMKVLVAFN